MRKLVIWHNESKGVYYHRLINGSYIEQDYLLGNKNAYGHTIVHIIDDFDYYKKKVPLKKKLIGKTINILSKYR